MLCGVAGAWADTKVALVIGNSHYTSPIPALSNPTNDATDIAASLKKVGFDVVLKTELDKAQFDKTLADFARAASNADVALFYYAGHGVQYRGQNYFLPVDATPRDNKDIEFLTVAMSSVVKAANEAHKTKIIILDACRNGVPDRGKSNSRSVTGIGDASGLAPIDGTDGMIVFYSAEHGKQAMDGGGANSPFANSLVKRISEPGREIKEVFTEVTNDVNVSTNKAQHPEIVTAELTSDVFLNPTETAEAVWDRVHKSNDPAVLRDFIKQFPDSPQSFDAQDRLDKLDLERRLAEREAQDKAQKEAAEKAAAEKQAADKAAADKRAADAAAAEQARLAKEKADREAADKKAQQEAAAKAATDQLAAEKQRAEAAAAEQARLTKEKAEDAAAAKLAAEEAAAAKKKQAEEADADRQEADRLLAEEKAREAEEAEAAKKKAEADIEQAKLDEQARKQHAAADAAKLTAEACARDQSELAALRDAKQADAIQALRAHSVCPATPAAADQALKEIAAYQAKLCAADQATFARLDAKNEAALRAALDTLKCDSVRAAAQTQIAKLEDESRRQEQACTAERAKFTAIDAFAPSARDELSALLAKPACPALRTDIPAAVKIVDERIQSAQTELKRVGCYNGAPSGRFDQGTIAALAAYLKARHASPDAPRITEGLVDELQEQDFVVCVAPSPAAPSAAASPAPAWGRVHRMAARPSTMIRPRQERPAQAPEPKSVAQTASPPAPSPAPAAEAKPGPQFLGTGF
ncbi:MAG: caspase family protein [Roseiarcus sp.]